MLHSGAVIRSQQSSCMLCATEAVEIPDELSATLDILDRNTRNMINMFALLFFACLGNGCNRLRHELVVQDTSEAPTEQPSL